MMGQGKKELTQQARYWEARRDHAQRQIPTFDYSATLFQIAIVLSSVAIIATSRQVLILSLVVGAVAALLMLNGFFLFYQLPLE